MREKISEYPALVQEWDWEKNGDLRPEHFTVSSSKKTWWKCRGGHSWQMAVAKRIYGNQGCPYCSNKKVLKGFNDLVTTHPRIADEWDYDKNGELRPEQFSAGSGVKIWWKCKSGHSWQAIIKSRRYCKCPVCSGKIVNTGINDLGTVNPVLSLEWDYDKNNGVRPENVFAHSNQKAWWKCAHDHSWQAVIASRSNGYKCPYCANQAVLTGYNDLKTMFPELLDEWDYTKNNIKPEDVASFSHTLVWWKCKRGHSWRSAVSDRSGGNNCPVCVGKRSLRLRLVK